MTDETSLSAVPVTHPLPRFTLVEAGRDRTRDEFREDVRTGLSRSPKRLSCRFFYDARGSRLFEEICALPEYYPFRAESEILRRHAGEIAARCGHPPDLVELGSGSGDKTRILIDALLAARGSLRYVSVDISKSALESSARALLSSRPSLRVVGIAGEYQAALAHLPPRREGPRLVLWLGSNIGNLERDAAAAFLRDLRERMDPEDALLLGVDLRKDPAIVQPAYDDAQGVTARFNKNLLARINRELGGEFDLDAFEHRARYLEDEGRISVHLVSKRAQTVRIGELGVTVELADGEGIHTENSIKYSHEEIAALAKAAHLRMDATYHDSEKRFVEVLLRPL